MTETASRARGRPRDPAKRLSLLAASRALFLRHGVDGVTVDQVIHDAGVSRATYYRYFKSRDDLLAAVIGKESERVITDEAVRLSKRLSLRDALIGFGDGFIRFLADPDTIRLEPLILYVRDTRPSLCLSFFEAGPRRVWNILGEMLEAGIARGELDLTVDVDQSVNDLIGLWYGTWYAQMLYGKRRALPARERRERVVHTVDLFLRGTNSHGS